SSGENLAGSSFGCSLGKVLTKNDYDYGSGGPGGLLRTTTYGYEYQQNTNYATNNLLDLESSVQVTGSGPGAYTTYGYDEYGLQNVGAVGTQHDPNPP